MGTPLRGVSKVDIHCLLYPGSTTKVYAHLSLWFGGSNHMNVGYSSTDAKQIHRQITDMISRGIDGVIVDWHGPNNSIDQATKLVMTEAEEVTRALRLRSWSTQERSNGIPIPVVRRNGAAQSLAAPRNYTVTINGDSGSTQVSTIVTVIVK